MKPSGRAVALAWAVGASCAFASSAPAAFRVARLAPDGAYPVAPDVPVRFTFAPESEVRGATMESFSLWVRAGGQEVARREVKSSDPVLELPLGPGRYTWGVQWRAASGQLSQAAEAGLLVAAGPDAWEGVPWLGAADANEFLAEATFGAGDAELMVATLGFGYVTVNGQEVSPDVLSYSGWTETAKRVLFRSYNITSLLNATRGATFRVFLGCGYRCDPQNRFPAYQDPADRSQDTIPKIFRLQVHVAGQRAFCSGSRAWMARSGPVSQDSVYGGETYVAAAAGAWKPAAPLPAGWGPKGAMVPATFPGVQVLRQDSPVSITQPAPGVHVVDFGSNVAGVCSISVPAAATVSLKHGELMQHARLPDLKTPDPSRVYFGNLRSAEANDTLVADAPIQGWWPRFTYHGFRYVEVYGYPGELTASAIKRLVLGTAVPEKASANFSDEVLQAIHVGSRGAQRSNLMQVPTDCPQRDERLGWMGDMSLSVESMLLHFDMSDMAAAFVDSMVDTMGADGSLPDVVPHQRYGGRPADLSWSSAFVGSLHAMWKAGDLRPAAAHWLAIEAHVGNLESQLARAGGKLVKLPEPYGDWCPPPVTPGARDKETPSKGFAAAFSLVHVLQQAAELGTAIGGPAAKSAQEIADRASKLAVEFHQSYYNKRTKQYDNGAMITYVLPFALGVVPASEQAAVVKNLLGKIAAKNNTWSGGIINNRFLFDVLHDHGAADVALGMLQRKTYPSYGYMYFNEYEPARECMWELPDAPFQGTGMNSRNHHMFSAVGHYLLTRVAGLSQGPDGDLVAVVGQLQGASVRLRLPRGDASFRWARSAEELEAELQVPVGLSATVHVPSQFGALFLDDVPLQEGGAVLRVSPGVQRHGSTFTSVTVSSGHYLFRTAAPRPASQLVV